MSFQVEFTPEAQADLERLFDHLLERATTLEDAMHAHEMLAVLREVATRHLSLSPYSYRRVGQRPTLRELIVPLGATGYVLRFDIRTPSLVLVLGVRHQREEDYH